VFDVAIYCAGCAWCDSECRCGAPGSTAPARCLAAPATGGKPRQITAPAPSSPKAADPRESSLDTFSHIVYNNIHNTKTEGKKMLAITKPVFSEHEVCQIANPPPHFVLNLLFLCLFFTIGTLFFLKHPGSRPLSQGFNPSGFPINRSGRSYRGANRHRCNLWKEKTTGQQQRFCG
jgi:hypothetical protein